MTEHRHGADCGCYRPDNGHIVPYVDSTPAVFPTSYQGPPVVNLHQHQAPPDKTVQRLALGAGIGAGAVGSAVYFGPLLTAALASMAVTLVVTAVCLAVAGWVIVTVVRSVGGTEGQAAAKSLRKRR